MSIYKLNNKIPKLNNIIVETMLPHLPTIITGYAVGTNTGCTAYGNITYDGGATITDRGFAYGTGATPTISGAHIHVTGTTGNFKATLTGVTVNTTNIRAFAVNSVGTVYGATTKYTNSIFNGMQAIWTFNETSGATTFADSSGYGRNLIRSGCTSQAGKNNNGIYFGSGSTQFAYTTSQILNFERTDSFSYSAWIKMAEYTLGKTIASRVSYAGGSYNGGYLFTIVANNDRRIYFYLVGTTWSSRCVLLSNTAIPANTNWHNIIFTYGGGGNTTSMKIYINGVDAGDGANYDTLNNSIKSNTNFYVGRVHTNTSTPQQMYGMLDEIYCWNRVITAAEIVQIYCNGFGRYY